MNIETLREAIKRYNRYRSPEATARLLEAGEEGFAVEFSGSFCLSCGVYDWLEDLIYEIRELDPELHAEISSWRWVSDEIIVAEFKCSKRMEKT